MTQKRTLITRQEADDLAESLTRLYGIRSPNQFASYVLDRTVSLDQLTKQEALKVRIEARAAYAPVEQKEISLRGALYDAMSAEQTQQEVAAWLR